MIKIHNQALPKFRFDKFWRPVMIGLPYFWLLLFFFIPFLYVFQISFSTPILAQPPYSKILNLSGDFSDWLQATLDNYLFLLEDNLYWVSYLKSVKVAFISTLICLLIGYPLAYGIARAPRQKRHILLMLVILPFWSSFLLRVYAWMGILSKNGLINSTLVGLGLIDKPLAILYTDVAVYLGIVYTYIPFMILPLYASIEKLDSSLSDAASDLGANRWQRFFDITLPLTKPGIIAGSLLVFIPAIGEYVIPTLLGGIDSLMIGRTLYDEFFLNRDWPLASAVATILLLIIVLPIMWFQRNQQRTN
tara:strand:- start:1407 stop:2321 length:915 start_codon:yes stop_codon:yes gene_type:complete